MPRTVPTPVAAALGLVPTVLSGVRRLPGKAVQLPVLAVSSALNALDEARREYDELAERGEQLVARLRGTALEDLEDRFDDELVARVHDVAPDVRDEVHAVVSEALPAAASRSHGQQDGPSPEDPKGVPTPKASEPSAARIDTAASPDVVETVEEVAAAIGVEAVTSRDDLPLPDYDHMTLGSLRGRLRSLDVPQLVQIREYEKTHADRLPVVTMLDNRIARLATDAAVTPVRTKVRTS